MSNAALQLRAVPEETLSCVEGGVGMVGYSGPYTDSRTHENIMNRKH